MLILILIALCLASFYLGWTSHDLRRLWVLYREAVLRRREVERWREAFERSHDWGSGERVEVYFAKDQGGAHSYSGDCEL